MKLFKYYPPERIDVLRTLTVRYTQPIDFNDPFDFSFTDQVPSEEIAKLRKDIDPTIVSLAERGYAQALTKLTPEQHEILFQGPENHKDKFLKEFLAKFEPEIAPLISRTIVDKHRHSRESLGVFSLAAESASLLMWAHYAAGHRGFLIEFNSDHPYFNNPTANAAHIGQIRKIDYPENNAIPYLCAENERIFAKLFSKSFVWKYEQEWRHVRPLADADDWKSDDIHLFKIPPDAITAVILGVAMKPGLRKEITGLISRSAALSNIKIIEATLSNKSYQLSINR